MRRKPASTRDRERSRDDDRMGAGDRRRPLRRKVCKLCADRVGLIDFRDTMRLAKFTSERGKILPRRVSGNCARHQRQLARAVKRARAIALMPYLATG